MVSSDTSRLISELNEKFSNTSLPEVLSELSETFSNKHAFASSLGLEDQVLTHYLSEVKSAAKIFTLDTGRLFPETLDLIDMTAKRYDVKLEVYFPDPVQVEEMVNTKGINLFYESIENRKLCCHNRKIIPMKRALEGMEAWITGLRADQSVTRHNLEMVSWDENFGLIKINPLIKWSEKDIWNAIRAFQIPYNPLHDKGYPSIGCQPCTRAIEPGEDIRSGRWWWEMPENKECGLHK
jgi:phosphoadenosine phosphosulfate reductase